MLRPIDLHESLSLLANCLHASFTADNHDSLGDDVTRSLLHLSREEFPAGKGLLHSALLTLGPRSGE